MSAGYHHRMGRIYNEEKQRIAPIHNHKRMKKKSVNVRPLEGIGKRRGGEGSERTRFSMKDFDRDTKD